MVVNLALTVTSLDCSQRADDETKATKKGDLDNETHHLSKVLEI